MEKRKPSKKKKIILLICSLLILACVSIYGIRKLAFGYDVVTWDGTFQFSNDNFYYRTSGNSYCTYSWNGKSVQVNQGSGGFSRSGTGGSTRITVDEAKAAAYLVPQWSGIDVYDTVTWQADSSVDFGYTGLPQVSKTCGSVQEAIREDNTNRDSIFYSGSCFILHAQ